jgi:hypothetical protein
MRQPPPEAHNTSIAVISNSSLIGRLADETLELPANVALLANLDVIAEILLILDKGEAKTTFACNRFSFAKRRCGRRSESFVKGRRLLSNKRLLQATTGHRHAIR